MPVSVLGRQRPCVIWIGSSLWLSGASVVVTIFSACWLIDWLIEWMMEWCADRLYVNAATAAVADWIDGQTLPAGRAASRRAEKITCYWQQHVVEHESVTHRYSAAMRNVNRLLPTALRHCSITDELLLLLLLLLMLRMWTSVHWHYALS